MRDAPRLKTSENIVGDDEETVHDEGANDGAENEKEERSTVVWFVFGSPRRAVRTSCLIDPKSTTTLT